MGEETTPRKVCETCESPITKGLPVMVWAINRAGELRHVPGLFRCMDCHTRTFGTLRKARTRTPDDKEELFRFHLRAGYFFEWRRYSRYIDRVEFADGKWHRRSTFIVPTQNAALLFPEAVTYLERVSDSPVEGWSRPEFDPWEAL